jgi:hypothetical protein
MCKKTPNHYVLTVPEIAAWQIADDRLVQVGPEENPIIAGLPALQRGAVWKVQQVEEVWDSLVRGFPVGAFLVSPIDGNKDYGKAPLQYLEDGVPESTHHLLDGQQRATAIALGFLDLWRDNRKDDCQIKSALWVDLASSPVNRDVEFVFRVLTKSHPWGYTRDYRRQTLHLKEIRQSLDAFDIQKLKNVKLKDVWPKDAIAPVPVVFLLLAAKTHSCISKQREFILEQLKKTSFWKEPKEKVGWHEKQQSSVRKALINPNERFELLMQAISHLQDEDGYSIPVLKLDINNHIISNKETGKNEEERQDERPENIETLFVRINSKGTQLEGEELIYSMLKAAWPDAPDAITKIRHKMATPSRLALLCARLVLVRNKKAFQSSLSIRDFRRLMWDQERNYKTFSNDLKDFIKEGGITLFSTAHKFLTAGEFALPPVLATELAQHAPEVFFLFLRWLDLMIKNGVEPMHLTEDTRRKTLGFLTAIAWFSPDRGESAAKKLWPDLNEQNETNIGNFFDNEYFRKLLKIEIGVLPMIPLIAPNDLENIINESVIKNIENEELVWTDTWGIWEKLAKEPPKQVVKLFATYSDSHSEAINAPDVWNKFIGNKLWSNHSILLYAQRIWIKKWFEDFDPSLPECLEDKNRPWDYDHIHPQSFLSNDSGNSYRNIPNIIRVWHRSIGNLRAWPLEANRQDGDSIPSKKLSELADIEHHYGMCDEATLREASFIREESNWENWKVSAPDVVDYKYLLDKKYNTQRIALISAITTRFVHIYDEWYKNLRIDELMKQPHES